MAVTADSKTDLFKLNDEWLKTHENPFPERGQIEKRGFFLFGRPAVEVDFGDAGGFGLGCHVGCLSVVVDGVSGLVGVARSDPTALRATIAKRLLPR